MNWKNKIKTISSKIGLIKIWRWIKGKRIHFQFCSHDRKLKKRMDRINQGKSVQTFSAIKQYCNIHDGQRCFIVSTGPSLRLEDIQKLKNEYTFSMNSVVKLFDQTDWRPTYYVIQDLRTYQLLANEPDFQNIRNKFIGDSIIQKKIKPLIIDHDAIRFPLMRTVHAKFSDDVFSIVYEASVTYSALQIAVYMGFKEIYLIGCDCDYSGPQKHFADYGRDGSSYDPTTNMKLGFQAAKEYCDTHGIKIYNATRGGKLEIFERVNFDDLFA